LQRLSSSHVSSPSPRAPWVERPQQNTPKESCTQFVTGQSFSVFQNTRSIPQHFASSTSIAGDSGRVESARANALDFQPAKMLGANQRRHPLGKLLVQAQTPPLSAAPRPHCSARRSGPGCCCHKIRGSHDWGDGPAAWGALVSHSGNGLDCHCGLQMDSHATIHDAGGRWVRLHTNLSLNDSLSLYLLQ